MASGRSRGFVRQRRETIASILKDEGRAGVSDLADRLGTSPLTIRRDLDALEKRGIVVRRYGEAVLVEADGGEATEAFVAERAAIAQAAAKLVSSDELLFVNTSSTALDMVPHINAHVR